MISKECKYSMEGGSSNNHGHNSDVGIVKSSESRAVHSEIINNLSINSDRLINAKNKAIWRLSFEVSKVLEFYENEE